MQTFQTRAQAGQLLAEELIRYANQPQILVLALPRGGVAVAAEIAKQLHVAMDLCLVRKLGVPWHEELAMGAIAYDGAQFVQVLNDDIVQHYQITTDILQTVLQAEQAELLRRNQVYRQGLAFPHLKDRHIILVDDGIATGATMRAAVKVIKQAQPVKLTIAVPVAEPSICEEFAAIVDEVICLLQPEPLLGVGSWYEHFPQLTDHEVIELLNKD